MAGMITSDTVGPTLQVCRGDRRAYAGAFPPSVERAGSTRSIFRACERCERRIKRLDIDIGHSDIYPHPALDNWLDDT